MKSATARLPTLILSGLTALVAGTLILVATAHFGPGISPDSAAYLSAAQNLASGNGLVLFDGSPLTSWPPLYPMFLALVGLLPFDLLASVRWFQAGLLAASVFFISLLVGQVTGRTLLAAFAGLVAAAATPLFIVTTFVWSGGTFALLLVLAMFALYQWSLHQDRRWFAALVIITAAACLVRYNGVIILAAGAVTISLFSAGDRRTKVMRAALFTLLSALPLAVWLLRNWLLTGHPTGVRPPSDTTLLINARQAIHVVTSWAMPAQIPLWLRSICVGGGVALLLWLLFRRNSDDRHDAPVKALAAFGVLTALFCSVLVVIMCSVYSLDIITGRFLLPVYTVALVLVPVGVDRLLRLKSLTSRQRRPAMSLLVVVLLGWCLLPLHRTWEAGRSTVDDGAGVFTSPRWRQSATLAAVEALPQDAVLLSNAPGLLWVRAGRSAGFIPRHVSGWDSGLTGSRRGHDRFLVWFKDHYLRHAFRLKEIEDLFTVTPYTTLADGAIYRIERPVPHSAIP